MSIRKLHTWRFHGLQHKSFQMWWWLYKWISVPLHIMVSHIHGLTLLWLLVHWNTLVSGNASSLNAVFTLPISRTFTTARLPSSYMASNLYRTGPRLKIENYLLELPILVKPDYQFSRIRPAASYYRYMQFPLFAVHLWNTLSPAAPKRQNSELSYHVT